MGSARDDGMFAVNPALDGNRLAQGVSSLYIACSNDITGGHRPAVGQQRRVALGRAAERGLMLDVNVPMDGYDQASNPSFQGNVGPWLAGGTPVSAAPEPATLTLLGSGLVGLAGVACRRKREG